jgi:2-keto-4-pentenoate hydratase/2-oxohepta-3-ene-1,7-dioic acid hydratase in catechol pathway
MLYQVPYLVSYLLQFFTLHPGEIVSIGTPPGVGQGIKPPRYPTAANVVALVIEGLGEQRQVCIDDDQGPNPKA